jgi:branched-chain amino acid aminotransferase
MTQAEMVQAVVKTCKANGLSDGYIRLVVTRGVGELGLNPYLCQSPQVIIIASGIQLYPKKLYETGMAVVTVGTVRNHVEAVNPRIKSLNYLNNVLAKIEAINAGVMECIMLNPQGYVAEASGDNIFVIARRAADHPAQLVRRAGGHHPRHGHGPGGRPGARGPRAGLSRYDLYTADEVFLTGTAAEIISVTNIDRRPIGEGKPGPVTGRLAAAFHKLTEHVGTPIR